MYNKYVNKHVTFTDQSGHRSSGYLGYYEDDQPEQSPINLPAVKRNSHPLLIAGVVIGLLVGLIACLPKLIRGWVVLGLLVGITWFGWSIVHDVNSQRAYAGVNQPEPDYVLPDDAPPMASPTVEVRRAELVRLPSK